MWNLYIEVIAIVIVLTISLTLLATYITYNIHITQLCQATNIKITPQKKKELLIISSEPEYIGITLYNICYINDHVTYNYTIITTPTAIKSKTKNCILVLVAPGSITVYPECKQGSSRLLLYVSPCGITSSPTSCYPWAEIELEKSSNEVCGLVEKSSFKLAKKWCTGVPELYIWAGGLIKGVVR